MYFPRIYPMKCPICNGNGPFKFNDCGGVMACDRCHASIHRFTVDFLGRSFAFTEFKPIRTFVPCVPTARDVESTRKCIMCKRYSYFYHWGEFFDDGFIGLCPECSCMMNNFVKYDLCPDGRRMVAAKVIQRAWRTVSSNPKYVLCHKIQLYRLHKCVL